VIESDLPSIGVAAQTACILDVASFKPGNVSFSSNPFSAAAVDFLLSGAAIAPVLDRAPYRRVGDTILECVRETRRVTATNTNLGIVLLLAPLASVPNLGEGGDLARILLGLDVTDARAAYQAIRLAQPGGLGTVAAQDVAAEPTVTLRAAMALAADRDLVARQYVTDFAQVFEGAAMLRDEYGYARRDLGPAVTRTFLRLLAKYPDSLIGRKYGPGVAAEVSRRARRIVDVQADPMVWQPEVARFDHWLRQPMDAPRNPGTTADLVTAALFVALRRGIIPLPFPHPFGAFPFPG
jgi:triphosphoribosyl-dephospho-CoA synthase